MWAKTIIGPIEFAALFAGVNRIAFVGNSSELVGQGQGAVIDEADIVVRFNLFRTLGFEADVGRNTSIFVTNCLDPEGCEPLENRCNTDALSAAVGIVPLEQLADELSVSTGYFVPPLRVPFLILLATLSRMDFVAASSDIPISKWTTGTYAIYQLTTLLKPKEILVSGFNLFRGESENVHYFNPKSQGRRRADRNHDLLSENQVWKMMIERLPCKVFVTSDVFESFPEISAFASLI